MSDVWATVNVSVGKDGIEVEDSYSLDIYASEVEARAAVEESLHGGGRTVALFKLEGLYQVSTIKKVPLSKAREEIGAL